MAKMTSDHIENVKEVHITAGADGLAVLLKGPDFDENLAERHVEIGASTVAFDNFSYRGQGFVTLGLGGLTYTVSPWSFFQSNWPMNIQSVETIANSLGELKGSRVLDLYAGGGNFSLMLSKNGAKVTAVEDNPHAVKDGERNALLNELKGVKFVRGRAENARAGGTFDVVILDPPRPGLTKAAMARILEWAPQKIVYVSCNPATFARDAKKLSRMYDLDSLRLVDFFPNTYHIESLAFLSKKAGQ